MKKGLTATIQYICVDKGAVIDNVSVNEKDKNRNTIVKTGVFLSYFAYFN